MKRKLSLGVRFVSICLSIVIFIAWCIFVLNRATDEDWTRTSFYVFVFVVGIGLALIPVLLLRLVKSWQELVIGGAVDFPAVYIPLVILLGLLSLPHRWYNSFRPRRRSRRSQGE